MQLLLIEQFYNTCSKDMERFIHERKPEKLDDFIDIADRFIEANKSGMAYWWSVVVSLKYLLKMILVLTVLQMIHVHGIQKERAANHRDVSSVDGWGISQRTADDGRRGKRGELPGPITKRNRIRIRGWTQANPMTTSQSHPADLGFNRMMRIKVRALLDAVDRMVHVGFQRMVTRVC